MLFAQATFPEVISCYRNISQDCKHIFAVPLREKSHFTNTSVDHLCVFQTWYEKRNLLGLIKYNETFYQC